MTTDEIKKGRENQLDNRVCSMKWIKIDRDENGFATEDCLDMMFTSLPIVVVEQYPDSSVFYSAICDLNSTDGWRGEIDRNTGCTHYLPIPKLEV